jgi:hypothetical protein
MKPEIHDPMLREIISGSEQDDFRRHTLEAGLGAVRRRRRTRAATRYGSLLAIVCLLALVIRMIQPATPSAPSIAATRPSTRSTPTPAGIKMISDEELFALFPGRAVALVGPPGQQQFVFLDKDRAQQPVSQ